jgi:hypothetical protein
MAENVVEGAQYQAIQGLAIRAKKSAYGVWTEAFLSPMFRSLQGTRVWRNW